MSKGHLAATSAGAIEEVLAGDGGFVLARDGIGVAASGVAERIIVDVSSDRPSAGVMETLRRRGGSAIACGALPFDPSQEAWLTIPADTVRGPVGSAAVDNVSAPSAGRRPPVDPAQRGRYETAVAEAVGLIRTGDLEKVVLARTLDITAPDVAPARLLHRLGRDPTVWCFAVGGGRSWLVGATPELLVRRIGRIVEARPLAGSLSRCVSRDGADLLASEKDRHEHAVAATAVIEALHGICGDVQADSEPRLVSTETMWHLGTRVRGVLTDPTLDALAVALRLHPTPAVCGTPRAAALDAIRRLEDEPRGCYAGPVGWVDASGDGMWVVALRCAQVDGDLTRLYAGSGIVEGSDPRAEWDETEAKLDTMLAALGLSS